MIIDDPATFSVVWSQTTAYCRDGCPPPPPVDFNSQTVLAVFLGERGNGGYWIKIDRIDMTHNNVITVHVAVTTPGNNCVVPQIITEPYDIVDIPKTNSTIAFITETTVVNCV